MEAILLIGVQGAGKTTFCTQRLLESHVRISQDVLKTPNRVRELVKACLAAKQPFVVDNTNALRSQRAEVIAAAKAAGFRVLGYYSLASGVRPSAAISSVRQAGFRQPAWRRRTNASKSRRCPKASTNCPW